MRESAHIFVLQHSVEEYDSEPKLLGIYRTELDAKEAIERFRGRLGFRNHPDGFHIDEYEVNKDYWETGFGEN